MFTSSCLIGHKDHHYVGGVEKCGLCSILAVCTALYLKDYREKLCSIDNDSEREDSVIYDYLSSDAIGVVRSTIEKYSQSTSIAVKPTILSVTNRQIGYLKIYEENIRVKKINYLGPRSRPSKNLPNYKVRPYVPESILIPRVNVEIKNWFADN